MSLIEDLEKRTQYDFNMGRHNFLIAQAFIWLGIVSSFGSAVAAAFRAQAWIVAVAAAIPGVVIIVDRSLNFAARGRWHDLLYTNIGALSRALRYEGASEKEISQKFSELLKASEESYPGLANAALNLPSKGDKEHGPKV
jgi:hypothetical protein